MNKRLLLFIFSLSFTCSLHGQFVQVDTLSPKAEICIMTAEPGPLLYQSWGHSSVLVWDPENRLEKIYNYGTFNFKTPNFYLKFARGKLLYMLSAETLDEFLRVYNYYNQTVQQQVLDLEQEEKQALYEFLENNLKPENRSYRYDFLFDNCATRIQQGIEQTLSGKVNWTFPTPDPALSFRDAIEGSITQKPWMDMGLDLILGLPTDRKMVNEEYTFHPNFLYETLKESSIKKDGKEVPLVKYESIAYQAYPTEEKRAFHLWPELFSVILVLAYLILSWSIRTSIWLQKIDAFLFFIVGLAGIVLLFMWVGTEHKVTKMNLNLLWLIPTHLVASLGLAINKIPDWLIQYLKYSSFFLGLMVLLWFFLPQDLPSAGFPLTILIGLRTFHQWKLAEPEKTEE
ncbi:MAG: DUF4105 domain-containing protein [Bacteroidota bacterium]